jgi:hypothetical protein
VQTINRELSTVGESGNAHRALDALKLSADQLSGLDADKKLALIADQVQALGLDSGQTTAVLRDLGVRNREMVLLVSQGGDALRAARNDVADYGLAISEVDAQKIEAANDAMARLGLVTQYAGQQLAMWIVPALGRMAEVMTDSLREGGALRAVIDGLVNNLDRLAVYAGVAVTAFGTYYVGALVAARIATFSLAGSLTLLRTALIRTGIGALIVVAGELVLRFTRLVESVGGFGNALGLMKNVAVEVFDRIGKGFSLIPQAVQAGGAAMNAWFTRAIGSMAYSFVEFTWTVAEGLNDLFGTNIRGASGVITQELTLAANEAQALADAASATMTATKEAMIAPLASIAAMRAATVAAGEAIADAGDGAGDLSETLDDVETAAGGAASGAESLADTLSGQLASVWGNVASAFGDFVANGFKEFKSFASGIKATFKQLLSDLISTAVKNKIMIGLGLAPTGSMAGGLTGASGGIGGGLLSGLMGNMGGSGGIMGALTGGGGLAAGFSGLAGGSGLMGGLGSTLAATFGSGGGLGGLLSIGANAGMAGGGLMATMGAALPIAGIALAAVSFFKKKTKLLDSGIRATINMEDAMFESFEKIQTSRFWGLSKKTSYKYSAMSEADSDPINDAVRSVQDGVVSATAALGISADAFDGFTHSFKVSLKGLDDAAKEAAITDALAGLGDAMSGRIDGLAEFTYAGEGAYDALTRLSTALVTVNDVFRDLGFNTYNVSLAGADAASYFADLFGSLENFGTATAAYYDQFYTDEEKLANATARLTEALADIGVDFVPETNAAFREMVDTAMLGGDTDLAASLIQLAPVFDSVTDAAGNLESAALAMRGAYQLDGSGYATAFDAKIAYEAANQGAITQGLINAQNVELQAQSDLLKLMYKELVKQSNAAVDSNVQSSFG